MKLPSAMVTPVRVPSASTVAPVPTRAVTVLVRMATAAEAPTPALPPKAPLPAIMSISLSSSADTMTLPSLCTVAPSAISPLVVTSTT